MKALVYLRVSTTSQSIESQKQDLIPFITSKGYNPDNVFWLYKVGASAYKIDDDYLELKNRMYDYILSHPECKTIFTWHINRLGRDEIQLQEIRKFCVSHQIQLFIKEPSLYLLNDDGTENSGMSVAFSLFATMSRLQIDELRAKTIRAKKLNAKLGKYNGAVNKLGYMVKDGYVVPDPDTKDIVITIFTEYLTGKYSCKSLADEMNARGYTYNGKPFLRRNIDYILSDTAYIGYTDNDTINSHRTYIPIISEEMYYKVKKLLTEANKRQNKESVHHYFGSKLIKCDCGHNWTANQKVYRCSYHYSDDKLCSCDACFRIDVLDGLLYNLTSVAYAFEMTKDNEAIKQELEKKITLNNKKISVLKNKISGIGEKKMKVQEGYENGIYNIEQYKDRLKKVNDEEKGYIREITLLDTENNTLYINKEEKGYGDRLVANYKAFFDLLDGKTIQDIIRQYIREVKIKGGHYEKHIIITETSGKVHRFVYYPYGKKDRLVCLDHKKPLPWHIPVIVRKGENIEFGEKL